MNWERKKLLRTPVMPGRGSRTPSLLNASFLLQEMGVPERRELFIFLRVLS